MPEHVVSLTDRGFVVVDTETDADDGGRIVRGAFSQRHKAREIADELNRQTYAIGFVLIADSADDAWEQASNALGTIGAEFVGDPRSIDTADDYDTPAVAAALTQPSACGAESG